MHIARIYKLSIFADLVNFPKKIKSIKNDLCIYNFLVWLLKITLYIYVCLLV